MSAPEKSNPSSSSDEYLFVYGTLRAAAGHRMNKVLEREGEWIGRGRVPGVLYDIGAYPGAVRKSGIRAYVHGDVYRLRNPQQALKVLDRYEGLDEGKSDGKSAEFKRSRVGVDIGRAKKVRAWIYLYNRPTAGLPRIRSGDYLRPAGRIHRPAARSSRR
jgi:gamma-glutamylcyclotransferase (GGCT)/AIG2-like uncharacterized protein YtfP